MKELKALAAGCKGRNKNLHFVSKPSQCCSFVILYNIFIVVGLPETTSPVASPPSFRRRKEVLVTPTALRESLRKPSCSRSVETSTSASESAGSSMKSTEEETGSLGELLDDSMGADLLQFTQEIESGLRQNESKTPKPQRKEANPLSSSKRKNRLSLSSKKPSTSVQKSVCRRINDVYEENHPQAKHNNNNVSHKIDFDDIDEAMMLSIGKLEEQEIVKPKAAVSTEIKNVTSSDTAKCYGRCMKMHVLFLRKKWKRCNSLV